jgi:hypothetical protein
MLPPEPEWHKKKPTNKYEWMQRCPLFEVAVKHISNEQLIDLLGRVECDKDKTWIDYTLPIIQKEIERRKIAK